MNPSSVSYTIERVRKAAQDPLFVRQGGTIAPTNHCHDLIARVDRILGEADQFRDERTFDAGQAVGDLTIYITSYETQLVLPQVVRRLRNEAPGIRLTLIYNFGSARDQLLSGNIDIYLGPQRVSDSGIYGEEFVNREQHICMMDPSHPLTAKSVLTLEDIKDYDHAHFEPRHGWLQAPFRHAAAQGIELRKGLISSDAISFGSIIVGTDLLAALPRNMALRFKDRLALRPFDFDTSMAEHMYWAAATDRSPLHRWVRNIIVEEARKPKPL